MERPDSDESGCARVRDFDCNSPEGSSMARIYHHLISYRIWEKKIGANLLGSLLMKHEQPLESGYPRILMLIQELQSQSIHSRSIVEWFTLNSLHLGDARLGSILRLA